MWLVSAWPVGGNLPFQLRPGEFLIGRAKEHPITIYDSSISRTHARLFVSQSGDVKRLIGGYSDALSTLFGHNYPTWTLQLNVSYPIGTSAADATIARAHIQESQVQAQLKQIELQIATDVTNAATNVPQSAMKRFRSSRCWLRA